MTASEPKPLPLAEQVAEQFEAIQAQNSRLRALIREPDPHAVQQRIKTLQHGDEKGLLHGMTVSLKDNIDTAGIPTTAGATFWRDRIPAEDAEVVRRLERAGAILFGKANMTELAWGVRSYSAVGGQCLNPLDESRIAGGSSGGSAASVVAGMCTASLGTDTGGSVRIPAAFCGLVGLRPTYGSVSNEGVLPLSESHDTVGPMARTVDVVARLYTAIAGNTHGDPVTARPAVPDVIAAVSAGVRGMVIGIPDNYYFDHCGDEIAEAVLAASRKLEAQGATIRPIKVPLVEDAQAMATCIMASEVGSLYEARLNSDPDSISRDIRERILAGLHYSGMDYARAVSFRARWRRCLHTIYKDVDITLVPTAASTAPPLSDERSLLEATRHLARNTYPSALAGIPSMSVPVGRDSQGLPIGMLIESRWAGEAALMAAAGVVMNAPA